MDRIIGMKDEKRGTNGCGRCAGRDRRAAEGASGMTHRCHWPDCAAEVPPALFMCRPHWVSLPKPMRQEIWRTYRRGQEISKTPSAEYLAAARAALDWARDWRPAASPKAAGPMRSGEAG